MFTSIKLKILVHVAQSWLNAPFHDKQMALWEFYYIVTTATIKILTIQWQKRWASKSVEKLKTLNKCRSFFYFIKSMIAPFFHQKIVRWAVYKLNKWKCKRKSDRTWGGGRVKRWIRLHSHKWTKSNPSWVQLALI